MRIIFLISFLFIIFLTSSCSRMIPLTSNIRQKLGDENVMRLQVYSSEKIVLKKTSNEGYVKTINGNIVIDKYESSETIIIPKRTKGIITNLSNDLVVIRFELGNEKVLPFGVTSGVYSLMAKEWKNKEGILEYSGKQFKAVETSGNSYLLVKTKQVNRSKRKIRIVNGVKIK
jgi:hypothetical protein